LLHRSIRGIVQEKNTRLEALGAILIRPERVMSSTAVHPRSIPLQARGAGRPDFVKALSTVVGFFRVLIEVWSEAQEMKCQAERRYPFMSFDS
jgi:hypothetical protein